MGIKNFGGHASFEVYDSPPMAPETKNFGFYPQHRFPSSLKFGSVCPIRADRRSAIAPNRIAFALPISASRHNAKLYIQCM